MIQLNSEFISGQFYEDEYDHKWYRHQYIDTPEPTWAREANDYYVRLFAAYCGIKQDSKILDLGSGVGRQICAWYRCGFKKVKGIEISETAIKHAESGCEIYHGTVSDMPMFKDNEFDFVTSAAFFEHIDESILDKVLSECFRVGVNHAHTIGLERGDDPGHINIKTMNEWIDRFSKASEDKEYLVAQLPDPLLMETPILVAIERQSIIDPLWRSYTKLTKQSKCNQ